MNLNRGSLTAFTKAEFASLYPSCAHLTLALISLSISVTSFKITKNGLQFQAPNWGFAIKFASQKKDDVRQLYLDFSIEGNVSHMHVQPVLTFKKICTLKVTKCV